jgi:hypothetical protein
MTGDSKTLWESETMSTDNREQSFEEELAEFEAEWNEEEVTAEEGGEESSSTEEVSTEEVETADESTDVEEVNHEQSDESTTKPTQEEKAHHAFERLRKENEEIRQQLQAQKRYADTITEIANKSGMTPEQVLEKYEQSKIAEEAKRNNVPVDVWERQLNTERELQAMKQQQTAERFNNQMNAIVDNYKLNEDDAMDFLRQASSSGFDVYNVDLDKVYRALNFETVLEREVEARRQKELAEKKKRQTSTAVVSKGSTPTLTSPGELSDEEFEEIEEQLRKAGAQI